MNQKRIILGSMVLLIIIGVVSAGLMSYLSNVVSGSVEVSGPVFYLDGDGNSLLLNEEPLDDYAFILNDEEIVFESEALGIDNLYAADFDISMAVKDISGNDTSYLNFEIIKIGLSENISICSNNLNIEINEFGIKPIGCSSVGDIDFSITDKLGIKIFGSAGIKVGYNYSGKGYSRIEVTKA